MRDKPLSFHWRVADRAWLDALGLPAARSAKAAHARGAILLDAVVEAEHAGRWISYSRRKAFYAGQRRYHGTAYTFRTVVPAVDELTALELIEHEKASSGSATGFQSRFRATDKLLRLPAPWGVRHDPIELVRLRHGTRLVDYRETARTERMRRDLEVINDALHSSRITFAGPGAAGSGAVIRYRDRTICLALNSLHRVFNDSFLLGGRLYGHWVQSISGPDRAHVRIDHQPTVEEDYAQIHPRLIYLLAGEDLVGDAYTLSGWSRASGKSAFNILVNAKTYLAAVRALANEIGGKDAYGQADQLIRAMKARHHAVTRFFHTGIGLRLQNIDATIAETVLLRLIRKGIVAVPIHDSFRVQSSHQESLREAMDDAFTTVVKNPDFFQLRQ